MVGPSAGACRDVDVEIVTRYAIPNAALQALGQFLADISPTTVAALQRFRHEPELF
jgi:hypothetical protein